MARCDLDGDGGITTKNEDGRDEFSLCPAYDGVDGGANAEVEAWPLFPDKFFHDVW